MMLQRATKRRIPTLQQSGTDCAASSERSVARRYWSRMMTEKSFHEAGHAVAASVLGQPIKQATMDGVTTLVKVGCDRARRNEAIIAMAGPAEKPEPRATARSRARSFGHGLGGRQGILQEAARRRRYRARDAAGTLDCGRQLGRRHEGSGGSGEARHALRRRCRRAPFMISASSARSPVLPSRRRSTNVSRIAAPALG